MKTPGQLLTRQQLRVYTLGLQGMSAEDIGIAMGLDTTNIHKYRKEIRTRLSNLASQTEHQVLDLPERTDDERIAWDVNMGMRCPTCKLTLPCRHDGEDGPCDSKSTAVEYLERLSNFWAWVKSGDNSCLKSSKKFCTKRLHEMTGDNVYLEPRRNGKTTRRCRGCKRLTDKAYELRD